MFKKDFTIQIANEAYNKGLVNISFKNFNEWLTNKIENGSNDN